MKVYNAAGIIAGFSWEKNLIIIGKDEYWECIFILVSGSFVDSDPDPDGST